MQTNRPAKIPPALRDLMPATAEGAQAPAARRDGSAFKQGVVVLLIGLGIMWAMELLDFLTPGIDFDQWGIHPRSVSGLFGILLAPILHGGLGHLISNSIPFVILGGLVMLRGGVKQWAVVTAFSAIVGGLLVWLLADIFSSGSVGSVHIGASGVIFGYFGFLVARGIFERSLAGILIAVVVVFLYGGFIWGVLPSNPHISWEGHLFGAASGVGLAFMTRPRKEKKA